MWCGTTAAYLVTAWRVYSSERSAGIRLPHTSRNIQLLHRRMGAQAQFVLPPIDSDKEDQDEDEDDKSAEWDSDGGESSHASISAELVPVAEQGGLVDGARQTINEDYEHVRRLNRPLPFEREYNLKGV